MLPRVSCGRLVDATNIDYSCLNTFVQRGFIRDGFCPWRFFTKRCSIKGKTVLTPNLKNEKFREFAGCGGGGHHPTL